MELKPNPFSVYDFLGYFVPGASIVYGAIVVYGYTQAGTAPLDSIHSVFAGSRPELYIPFVIVSYVIGHLASFLSSISIERYSVWRHGYPSKYLLGQTSDSYWEKGKSSLFNIGRIMVGIILAPISLPDVVVSLTSNGQRLYARPLDPFLINVIKHKTQQVLQKLNLKEEVEPPKKSDDSFRVLYHFAVEHAENHYPKMQNYVALYGFLRTTTFLLVSAFWILTWYLLTNYSRIGQRLGLILVSIILCNISYAAFLKFYRRFSLEAFMAVSTTHYDDEGDSRIHK